MDVYIKLSDAINAVHECVKECLMDSISGGAISGKLKELPCFTINDETDQNMAGG